MHINIKTMGFNDKYRELRNNAPKLKVKKDAKEVRIHLISCTCDNEKSMSLMRKEGGCFKLGTGRDAYGNFQMKFDKYEIEWKADEGEWDEVFQMINSGTATIEKVVSR